MSRGIYRIYNDENQKSFIGSSKNIESMAKNYLSKLKHGKHSSSKLQRSYTLSKNKDKFKYEILEIVDNSTELETRKNHFIEKFDSFYSGYNCSIKKGSSKYTEKDAQKDDLAKLYSRFESLWDEKYIEFGKTMKFRLLIRHYKKPTITQLIKGIEWFTESYDTNHYKLKFAYSGINSKGICILIVKDLSDREVGSFTFGKNKKIVSLEWK